MSISLSLLSDEPVVILNDGDEYHVSDDSDACLLDEGEVYDVFENNDDYDEYALEEINVERLFKLLNIVSTESLSPVAASLLQCASPVDLKIPAMEHFRNPNVNKAVTSIVKESVVNSVWNGIKKVFAAIAKFFKNLLSGKQKANKKIEKKGKDIVNKIRKETTEAYRKSEDELNKKSSRYTGGFPNLKAEINPSMNKEMDEHGGVPTPVFPLGTINDENLKFNSVYGYRDLYFLCNRPGETIKYENYLDTVKNFGDFIKKLSKHLGRLRGSIKVLNKCVKESFSLANMSHMTEDDIEKAKADHEARVSELNNYFRDFYDGFFDEPPMSGDKLQKFTQMMPGLVRWGATLNTDTDGPYKLIIKKRSYTNMSHIAPSECYIKYPDLGIVLPLLKKIESSIEFISDTDSEISAFIEEAGPLSVPFGVTNFEGDNKEIISLCTKIYSDIFAFVGNIRSVSVDLMVSFDVMRNQFLSSAKDNLEMRV